ncbi:MAG TPA: acyltransferase [Bacteroidetes bacterium]|nr:acyltransferase [Bacteroidota bacterium]
MIFSEKIKSSPFLKTWAQRLLSPKNEYRPRWWVSVLLNPFVHKRGRGSVIRRRTRMDVMPYNEFVLGRDSVIEDFTVVNNAVGDVIIGERTLIGMSDVIIGPITVGNDVLLAQHVVLSAMNHNYEDILLPISRQDYVAKKIIVEDEVWIGANAVVTAGVTIGHHSIVASGAVVTKDVPPLTVVVGNPARVIKRFNKKTEIWERVGLEKKN